MEIVSGHLRFYYSLLTQVDSGERAEKGGTIITHKLVW